jgi:methylenetetrahydrofolate dehydrogenase (NADP+)/methenyltetrahydrofolate cyclohydrolase
MSYTLIDGKSFAEKLVMKVADAVNVLYTKHQIKPGLAVVLVGQNPASEVYVKNKVRQTKNSGMNSIEHRLPETTSESELLSLVNKLNEDDEIDGILVQLPLPDHINENSIINAIKPSKDVDGFSIPNVGLLSISVSGLIPCTPLGCLLLLQNYVGDLSGKSAVIIGRSNIVGKPMAQLLLNENCTVTIAHSKTKNIEAVCQRADILVAAVGRPNFVKSEWVKKGAVVIDVGINRLPPEGDKKGRLVGDVDFDSVSNVASAITPVPGGVGPMTIACLLRNTVTAACKRRNLNEPEM